MSQLPILSVVGLAAFFIPVVIPAKAVLKMEAELFVGNLPGSMTRDELRALFAQAGEVTAADVIKDRNSGESKGFGFISMSAQNEADKAVSMFNRYALGENVLKVRLLKPRRQRGITDPILD